MSNDSVMGSAAVAASKEEARQVDLVPDWAGEFHSFDNWVNKATGKLTGRTGSVGEVLSAMCVDTLGRRCHVGKDFMRARDENTFPVRFFWEMKPAQSGQE